MKILITGSTGLIGSSLVTILQKKGHRIFRLVRNGADLNKDEIDWDPIRGEVNPTLMEGLDAVVHLAGESIMGRWTDAKKSRILKSRVEGTTLLCKALTALKCPPNVFISASAVGYYGNRGDETLTEENSNGEGFLAQVCKQWEEASEPLDRIGVRRVLLRFGMVLSRKGGALMQMLPAFKWGLGGKMGDGKQWMSWIALADLIRVVEFVLEKDQLRGPVNTVAPHPEMNAEFTRVLGSVLHRPAFMGMPAFVVKLALGELGSELLLSSQRVVPSKLADAGFSFQYPHLEEALFHILRYED